MDTSHTTTCLARIADQHWRNSEVSLGDRSMLVRAVDGSAPVEWLPYDDVTNVTEVDDPAGEERFIEVTARDGRRLSMQLDPAMLTSLLAVLADSSERPEEPTPRPAEFGIGQTPAPTAVFSTAPPTEPAADLHASPDPMLDHRDPSRPSSSDARRRWLLLGGLLALLAVLALGLFVLLGGDDTAPDPTPSPPTTDRADIDATPEPEADARTTTTVPTDPGADGPASALTVDVDDVVIDRSGDTPAIYLAFATTNETTREIGAYDIEVRLAAMDAQGRETSWLAQFRCAAPLAAETTRAGSFAEQPPGTDLDALMDCRVGAWPIDVEDPTQSTFAEAVGSGATWTAETRVVTVEFADGTVLD